MRPRECHRSSLGAAVKASRSGPAPPDAPRRLPSRECPPRLACQRASVERLTNRSQFLFCPQLSHTRVRNAMARTRPERCRRRTCATYEHQSCRYGSNPPTKGTTRRNVREQHATLAARDHSCLRARSLPEADFKGRDCRGIRPLLTALHAQTTLQYSKRRGSDARRPLLVETETRLDQHGRHKAMTASMQACRSSKGPVRRGGVAPRASTVKASTKENGS